MSFEKQRKLYLMPEHLCQSGKLILKTYVNWAGSEVEFNQYTQEKHKLLAFWLVRRNAIF